MKSYLREYKLIFSMIPETLRLRTNALLIFSLLVSFFEVLGLGVVTTYILAIGNENLVFGNRYIKRILLFLDISNTDFFILFGISIIITYLVKTLVVLKYKKLSLDLTYDFYEILASNILSNFLYMPFIKFVKRNSSNMTKIIMTDATHVAQILSKFFLIITELVTLSIILVVLFFIDIKVILFIIILMSVIFLFVRNFLSNKIKSYGKEAVSTRSKMFQQVDESLLNIKSNKIMNSESYCTEKFNRLTIHYGKLSSAGQFMSSLPRNIIEFIVVFLAISILILLILFNSLDIYLPLIIITLAGILRIFPSFFKVINIYNQIKYHYGSIRIISDNLKIDNEVYGTDSIIFNKTISLNCISFNYDELQVLKSMNFTITKGSKIALLGESGSGKSTIINLLLGLLTPKSGEIKIDEEVLNNFNVRSFRSKIGYIPQDIFLIDGTIRENILMGRLNNPRNLEKSIKLANLEEFIFGSQSGLDTLTGQNGIQISGGQKQRIGIARALYDNPEFLILDEATSALNQEMEDLILNEVFELSKGLTMIFVTHKHTFLDRCDFIYKIENGILNEVTHEYIT